MDPTARRHSLRDQLGLARDALDRGERAEALAAVERALQLDPDYLAAQALKERILAQPATSRAAAPAPATVAAGHDPSSPASPLTAGAMAAGVLHLETRTRARRIEKRAAAARAALARGRTKDARAAIEEIAAIDPQHPEHRLLREEIDAHTAGARRRALAGPVAAVVVLAALGLMVRYMYSPRDTTPPAAVTQRAPAAERSDAGTSSAPADAVPVVPVAAAFDDARALAAPPAVASPALPDAARPERPGPTAEPSTPHVPAFTPDAAPAAAPPSVSAGPEPPAPDRRPQPVLPSIAPIEPNEPGQLPGVLTTPPQDARARPAERSSEPVTASRSVAVAPVVATPSARDEDLVLRALQQYRRAYDTLDARAAQAVWPGVDSDALQRAFDGLVSQRLTFQSCELHVSGPAATAACRGSARYTPRVGSRDARDEPRDWRFTLRKTTNDDWQIESARVAR